MTLIKCKECLQEISDKSSSCPNCGAPNIEDRFKDLKAAWTPDSDQGKESQKIANTFFKRYFTYNNEKITGASYFNRLWFTVPLLCLMILPGVYWLYIISYKRTRALNWNIAVCHIISILNALLLPLTIGLPIHIVIWFGMFKVKK